MSEYDARKLTWAALLSRWVEFARSAVALPENEQGKRMKESVPDLIGLQAVTCALGEIDSLPDDERALGIDRAALLIRKHTHALQERFGDSIPQGIAELMEDARESLSRERTRIRQNRD